MCGCLARFALTWASRRKRSSSISGPSRPPGSEGAISLIATRRLRTVSTASKTRPIPPLPTFRSRVYFPKGALLKTVLSNGSWSSRSPWSLVIPNPESSIEEGRSRGFPVSSRRHLPFHGDAVLPFPAPGLRVRLDPAGTDVPDRPSLLADRLAQEDVVVLLDESLVRPAQVAQDPGPEEPAAAGGEDPAFRRRKPAIPRRAPHVAFDVGALAE